jgi:hypothetical protein
MTTYPTDKAWNYFLEYKDDIRNIVEQFLSAPQWQSMIGPLFGTKTEYDIDEFDAAVKNKNIRKLSSIMNDAWGRAPESRSVYSIPGFGPMCNLLDGTVEGWEG